jgi:20S proteasome alpha/beta subunit
MTVCIAAVCSDGSGKPCIVLCSDTRLDLGDIGSTSTAIKLDVLGHGWCVQMAGGWSNVCHWKDHLKRRVQTAKEANLEQISRCLKESAEYFSKSAFCESDTTYELLLSGFPVGNPVILSASLRPSTNGGHSLSTAMSGTFACIGSGNLVASTLLSARECHSSMSIEYVSYLVYEAKRISEKTGAVGNMTVLMLHSQGAEETPDRAQVGCLSKDGEAHLEAAFRGIWKVPFVTFPDFPAEFFTNPTEIQRLQSTIADPSRQQPSPESPAKSDES